MSEQSTSEKIREEVMAKFELHGVSITEAASDIGYAPLGEELFEDPGGHIRSLNEDGFDLEIATQYIEEYDLPEGGE